MNFKNFLNVLLVFPCLLVSRVLGGAENPEGCAVCNCSEVCEELAQQSPPIPVEIPVPVEFEDDQGILGRSLNAPGPLEEPFMPIPGGIPVDFEPGYYDGLASIISGLQQRYFWAGGNSRKRRSVPVQYDNQYDTSNYGNNDYNGNTDYSGNADYSGSNNYNGNTDYSGNTGYSGNAYQPNNDYNANAYQPNSYNQGASYKNPYSPNLAHPWWYSLGGTNNRLGYNLGYQAVESLRKQFDKYGAPTLYTGKKNHYEGVYKPLKRYESYYNSYAPPTPYYGSYSSYAQPYNNAY